MKILLVTDEAVLAELVSFRLELLGHSVETRLNAEQFFAGAAGFSYALAIVDTGLPDANVRDVLSKVRSRWSKNHLPVW